MTHSAIDVLIGTKAQYTKTAPLLRVLAARGIPYRLIDTGQHAKTTRELRLVLDIKDPDFVLQDNGNIMSIRQAAFWFWHHAWMALRYPERLRNTVFSPGPGLVVLHGDTPSTLLGLVMAKRAGKKIVHLEAGLRSFNLLRPFPEEIIRIIVMKAADLLFAPSDWAETNLRRLKVRGRIVNIGQNTNVEALRWSMERGQLPPETPDRPYCVVTFHRVETIMSRKRSMFMVRLMERIARDLTVVFVRHDPTEDRLEHFGMLDFVRGLPNLVTCPLLPHPSFLRLVDGAEFVLTDGGSIQEECSYLDKPCLVLRSETERPDGLDTTVRLCDFDMADVERFLAEYASLPSDRILAEMNPSDQIADVLMEETATPKVRKDVA